MSIGIALTLLRRCLLKVGLGKLSEKQNTAGWQQTGAHMYVRFGPVCRYNFFTGCPKAKTCTIILRGGAEQFMEETERSLHDAIMIVRRAIKVLAGGFLSAQPILPPNQ